MKTKKTIALALCAVMILAAFSACAKADADTQKILDFQTEEKAPEKAGDAAGNDSSVTIADAAALTELTGISFPAPDKKIDASSAAALYSAANRLYHIYSRVVLSDGRELPAGKVLTDEEKSAIRSDVAAISEKDAREYEKSLWDEQYRTAYIFWDLLTQYLPAGATEKLEYDVDRNSPVRVIAIADVESVGYYSPADLIAAHDYARDYTSYGVDLIEFSEYGDLFFIDAASNSSIDLHDPETSELLTVLGKFLSN